jgi:hypothetical protein
MIVLGSRSSATSSEVSAGTRNPIEFSFQDSTVSTVHTIGFYGKSKASISSQRVAIIWKMIGQKTDQN